MTDLQRSKSIIDSLFYDDGAISQNQYEIIMGVLNDISPQHPVVLDKIANDCWEGYDGSNENDKVFWINGFKAGYNYCKLPGHHLKKKEK